MGVHFFNLSGNDGDTVSLVIPVDGQDDKFISTITHDIVVVTWDGVSSKPSSVEVIATLEGKEENVRINDGKVDPAGRLWTGKLLFYLCYLIALRNNVKIGIIYESSLEHSSELKLTQNNN